VCDGWVSDDFEDLDDELSPAAPGVGVAAFHVSMTFAEALAADRTSVHNTVPLIPLSSRGSDGDDDYEHATGIDLSVLQEAQSALLRETLTRK
jgi:hypothetical protein